MRLNNETPHQPHQPDALRDIYRDAVESDRGPSAESTQRILAHALSGVTSSAQREEAIHTPAFVQQQPKPAANDRFWLRHALGGVAAVALVGWLMMLHTGDWTRDASKKQDSGASQSPAAAMEPLNTLVPSAEKLSPAPAEMGSADMSSAEVSLQPRADTAQRSARMAPAAPSPSPSSEKKAKELSATADLPLCPEEKLADRANSHRANSKSQQRAREEANKAAAPTCRPRKPAEILDDPKELQPPESAAER